MSTPPHLVDLTEVSASRYIPLEIIGAGGIGTVFRVQDSGLNNEPVALKLMNSGFLSDPNYVSRFKREVSLARKLSHPNIVKIFDFGEIKAGGYFFTMELVEGQDLRKRINGCGCKLPLDEVLTIIFQVITALDYAHNKGIIHRDIKPENILIARDRLEIKITDFSSAREIVFDQGLTPEGGLIGTPNYLAPELLKSRTVSAQIDIYSVGIILFELLTGSLPFVADAAAAVFAQHLTKPIPQLSDFRDGVPKWIQELIEICTEKNPANRFSSMSELLGELFRQSVRLGMVPQTSAIPESMITLSRSACSPKGFFRWL